jgi:hypothetical protein
MGEHADDALDESVQPYWPGDRERNADPLTDSFSRSPSTISMTAKPLWHGKPHDIPKDVAVCPECRGQLTGMPQSWDSTTGQPSAVDMDIVCINELISGGVNHRFHQCDWQPTRDAIAKWCGAYLD